MELRQLRYFAEVVRAGTFRGAGERLHVAQPALWAQVRGLERELGVPLFEKVGRNVRLTTPGAQLLERAHDVLAGAERVQELAEDLRSGRAGTITIVTPAPAVERALAALISRFRKRHPGMRVIVEEVSRADETAAGMQ